jgi:hypothetical protein
MMLLPLPQLMMFFVEGLELATFVNAALRPLAA